MSKKKMTEQETTKPERIGLYRKNKKIELRSVLVSFGHRLVLTDLVLDRGLSKKRLAVSHDCS